MIAWKSDCIWQLYFHVLSSTHQQSPVHSLIYLFRAPFCVITNAAVEYILTLSQKHIYNIPCQEADDDRAYQDKVMTSSLAGPRMDTYPSHSIFWLCLEPSQLFNAPLRPARGAIAVNKMLRRWSQFYFWMQLLFFVCFSKTRCRSRNMWAIG